MTNNRTLSPEGVERKMEPSKAGTIGTLEDEISAGPVSIAQSTSPLFRSRPYTVPRILFSMRLTCRKRVPSSVPTTSVLDGADVAWNGTTSAGTDLATRRPRPAETDTKRSIKTIPRSEKATVAKCGADNTGVGVGRERLRKFLISAAEPRKLIKRINHCSRWLARCGEKNEGERRMEK